MKKMIEALVLTVSQVIFTSFFWKDIGFFLTRFLNYGFSVGELSVTQKQGVMTCFPRGNNNKQFFKKMAIYLLT